MLRDILNKVKQELIKEATSDSGGRGSYVGPMQHGTKEFDKTALQPFNVPVSKYNDAMLDYDSYDGNNINQTHGKRFKMVPIKEASTSITSGVYNGPIELGLKKWRKEHLGPFQEFVDTKFNHKKKQKTLKNNIRKVVGVWEKNSDGSYNTPEHDVHTVNEWIEILPVEENPLRSFIKGVLRESL